MEFWVDFINEDPEDVVVFVPERLPGLRMLDQLRASKRRANIAGIEGKEGLSLEVVRVPVREDQARESGHFLDTTIVVVKVHGGLNGFAQTVFSEKNDYQTYYVKTTMREREIIAEWLKAGAPLVWDTSSLVVGEGVKGG